MRMPRSGRDQDVFDFIQANGIVGAVKQLGRARRSMARDLQRVLIDQPGSSSDHACSTGRSDTLIVTRPGCSCPEYN